MLRFDRATYFLLVFNFILSKKLSNSLGGSDVLLFLEFVNIVCILFYNWMEFIILLRTFLVTSFSWCKEYLIWDIPISRFSDVLPYFTCESATSNLWGICLGVNILISLRFCWLLKLRIFSIIWNILFELSFKQFLF